MGADEFKLDLHLHTTRFSPCSEMTPEEALSAAKAGGLDGVVMTEHGKNWPEADLAELSRKFELVVLGGVEVTTTAGDILVYGSCPEFDSIPTPEELVDACPDAFLVAAHPFRGFLLFGFGELDLNEAAERSPLHVVHGIEVTNLKVTPQENALAAGVAEHRGLVKIGGSDAHTVSEVGRAWSAFQDRVTTCAELVEALRQGHVKPSQR